MGWCGAQLGKFMPDSCCKFELERVETRDTSLSNSTLVSPGFAAVCPTIQNKTSCQILAFSQQLMGSGLRPGLSTQTSNNHFSKVLCCYLAPKDVGIHRALIATIKHLADATNHINSCSMGEMRLQNQQWAGL